MKKSLIFTIIIVASVAVFSLNKSKTKQAEKGNVILKIGISLPLTGSIAHLGESAEKGIKLASEELKRNHPDLNLKYFIEDNAFTGKGAVSAYRKLKDIEDIDAIITATSPVVLATQPLAQADNILQMGIFASTPAYSSTNDLSFRVFPRSEKEAEAIIEYLQKSNLQRLAIIYINNDFGQGVYRSISEKLSEYDSLVKITSQENYLPDTTDFKTQLAKIRLSNPKALLMIATAQDAVSIMRQAKTTDSKLIFLATSSASDPAVLGTSAATETLLVTDIFDPQSTNKNTQAFIANFEQKFGTAPDLWAAQGYDSYKLTALALEKCGRNGECTKSYLSGLKDYPTLLGNLTFDNNGDPDYNYFIKIFKNGRFEKLE